MPAPGWRPAGISPSDGSGIGGSTSLSRVVKSPPRQTRSSPDHADGVLEVVDDPVERPLLVADRERMQHEPEEPAGGGEGAELVVRQVAGVVVDCTAGRVRADDRGARDPLDDLGERRRRRMREVEDHPEPDELVDERAAEAREAAVLRRAVRERVAAVPRQPGHPDAELPERLRRPELVAELLDTLERQHQPDPLAALDGVEVGGRANLQHAVGVLAHRAQQARRLAEGLAQRSLRLALELDEDGADLQADAAGLEQGQPRPGKGASLAVAELAVAELEQQVEVGVRDHGGSLRGDRAGRRRERHPTDSGTGC